MSEDANKIRNIIIIAHVDHGKTTLVDGLLKQSHAFRDNQAEMSQQLIMDSGDQERERGITITAKITSIEHDGYRINIIDTPGHADFSGEVERTINMADGCLLIVDAQEGPMPQTKYVLAKALANNLKPIVIINKIDKQFSRIDKVEDEIADLFLELAVHESQLHYPVFYAFSRQGKAWAKPPTDWSEDADLSVIFEAIIKDIPAPQVEPDKPLQMLISALSWDSFNGKYAIGRINRGTIKEADRVTVCKKDGSFTKAKIDKILISNGISRIQIEQASAGDIVQLTGIPDVKIGETIADELSPEALPIIEIEEPTLKIYLGPNTSTFKGTEGRFLTGRQIGERLQKELETNVGLRVEEDNIGYLVSGRGELHLSVLIESLRREGYEFEVGRPQVVTKEKDGHTVEPIEELIIEVPAEYVGTVQMELGPRRAVCQEQFASSKGLTKLVYELPTRTLLGLRNILMTSTKGTVIMNSLLSGYKPLGSALPKLRNGALVAYETGLTTPYALEDAELRGICFVGPAEKVYAGQIVGLNNRKDDIEMNVCKAKHLTNMRSKSSDGSVQLTPATILSLEQCLDFIEKDELLEVTPKALRLRKIELNHLKRKRAN
ncbi:MAG TPA: translational GTPase TypA [Candidatus Saccharimonadales bacterium]|jgi:GTP-binding protein|nr:translational GTPase TypA [Candidatus Saccharimonadales bacterium]